MYPLTRNRRPSGRASAPPRCGASTCTWPSNNDNNNENNNDNKYDNDNDDNEKYHYYRCGASTCTWPSGYVVLRRSVC